MKKIVFFTFLISCLFNMAQAASIPDEIYDEVNHKLLVKARERMLEAIEGAREKLLKAPSYIQGIDIIFNIAPIKMTIIDREGGDRLESPPFSIPLDYLYDIPAKYKQIIQPGIFDLYNMYTPAQFFSSGDYSIVIEDGLQRGLPDLEEFVFRSAVGGSFSFDAGKNNRYLVTANIDASVGGAAFLRTKQYALKGKLFFSDKDRVANGGTVIYKWIGPRQIVTPGTTIFTSEAIENNTYSFLQKTGPASAEYDIKLEGVFCGCSVDVEHDRIFDPFGSTNQRLQEIPLVRAKVKGRLLIDMVDQEEPIKNAELALQGACEDADQCMGEVEKVKTDNEGRFEFQDVPKGVYSLMYKGKVIGTISNCDFMEPAIDAGDFKVIMPMRYEVEMIHKGGARSSLKLVHVKWPEIIIRPLSENVPLATLIASDDDPGNGRPVDTEGNPLTVPYVVKYPGYPQYDKTMYGVDMSDNPPEEIKIRTNYGTTCHLEQSPRAPMGIYLDYGDEPGSSVPYRRPLGHHFEADLSLMCGGRMQVMMQFMTGHPEVPEFPDHYTALPLVPDDMLKNWQRCVDFDKEFSNKAGDHITFKFKCLGPEKLGDDSDNPPTDPPGGCDDFEEDCGDHGGPATPPSGGDMPPGMGGGNGDGSLPPGMGDIIGGILGGLFGGN